MASKAQALILEHAALSKETDLYEQNISLLSASEEMYEIWREPNTEWPSPVGGLMINQEGQAH